jgi:hypothetical protein
VGINRPEEDVITLGLEEMSDGGHVLPGPVIPVSALFGS